MNSSTARVHLPTLRRLGRPRLGSIGLGLLGLAVVGALLPAGDADVAPDRGAAPANLAGGADRDAATAAGSRAGAAATPVRATASESARLPLDAARAERVAAAALLLVDGRAGLIRGVDLARADLTRLGGHTVSYNETEGRPTAIDPCPVPIAATAVDGSGSVAFPCPAGGQQADSAQLVVAVPVPKVEGFLRGVDGYGETLGRMVQIVDAQRSLDLDAARSVRLERQISRLRELIGATAGDTSALRGQLARAVAALTDLEERRATTTAVTRFAQVVLNLTTVRPPDAPVARNWFAASVHAGWDRLARLARRTVSALVLIVPVGVVLALAALPVLWHRRRATAGSG